MKPPALISFAGPICLLLLLVLTGCNLFPAAIEPAAVSYYNYMQGMTPEKTYSGFASPAYRRSMPKSAIDKLDDIMSRSRKKNDRAVAVTAEKIEAVTDAHFGLTRASSGASYASMSVGETRWVRDNGKWYLYLGSDGEIDKYGRFPSTLQFPPDRPSGPVGDPDVPQ